MLTLLYCVALPELGRSSRTWRRRGATPRESRGGRWRSSTWWLGRWWCWSWRWCFSSCHRRFTAWAWGCRWWDGTFGRWGWWRRFALWLWSSWRRGCNSCIHWCCSRFWQWDAIWPFWVGVSKEGLREWRGDGGPQARQGSGLWDVASLWESPGHPKNASECQAAPSSHDTWSWLILFIFGRTLDLNFFSRFGSEVPRKGPSG